MKRQMSILLGVASVLLSLAPAMADAGALRALTQKLRQQESLKQRTEARAAKQRADQRAQQTKQEKRAWSETVAELTEVAKEHKEPLKLSHKSIVFHEEQISHSFAGGTMATLGGPVSVPGEKVTATRRLELNEHGLQEVTRGTKKYDTGEVEPIDEAKTIALPGKVGRVWTRVKRALETLAGDRTRARLLESALRRYQGAITKDQVRKAADDWVKEGLASP
jgi:hypothetical protein